MGIGMMRAGRLRHYVTIESKTVTRDTNGAPLVTWAPLLETWAAVEPLRGTERVEASQLIQDATMRVVMRYDDRVDASMRILFDGRYYQIEAVVDRDGRHIELELLCRELTQGDGT